MTTTPSYTQKTPPIPREDSTLRLTLYGSTDSGRLTEMLIVTHRSRTGPLFEQWWNSLTAFQKSVQRMRLMDLIYCHLSRMMSEKPTTNVEPSLPVESSESSNQLDLPLPNPSLTIGELRRIKNMLQEKGIPWPMLSDVWSMDSPDPSVPSSPRRRGPAGC